MSSLDGVNHHDMALLEAIDPSEIGHVAMTVRLFTLAKLLRHLTGRSANCRFLNIHFD